MFCHFFFNRKLILLIAVSAFQGSLNAPASSGPCSIFVDGLGDESTSGSVVNILPALAVPQTGPELRL